MQGNNFSFVTKGFNRIQRRSFMSWIVAEEDANHSREGERNKNREGGNQSRPSQDSRNERRDAAADEDANQSAHQTQNQRFRQELQTHIIRPCAHSHSNADFACPLGDGYQHDIHDSDAAHYQRDGGDASQQQRHDGCQLRERLRSIGHIADHEVVRLTWCDFVPLGHTACLLADRGHHCLIDRWNLLPKKLSLSRGIRNDRGVVLILAYHRLTLCRQYAYYTKRQIANTNRFADRIDSWKQLFRHGFSKHNDSRRGSDIRIREKVTLFDLPCSNFGKLLVGALDTDKPVLIPENQLPGRVHHGGHGGYGGNLALHGVHIVVRQCGRRAGAQSCAAEHHIPRHHIHHVRAHTADLIQDHGLGALSDRHQHDHRTDANNDAKHG